MAWQKALQIVHITDLHVMDVTANANHALAEKNRILARALQRSIEKRNAFGWHEGTQGHYWAAAEGFTRFLEGWRHTEDNWYGHKEGEPHTWLIDTGDLTTFGDQASISLGHDYLHRWRGVLGNCQLRTLYGNHDAWPGTQPAHMVLGWMFGDLKRHKRRTQSLPGWNADSWLFQPLRYQLAGTGRRIELYAFDSVLWNTVSNTLAVGNISKQRIDEFRSLLRMQAAKNDARNFRIAAMHHPLAFPYTAAQSTSLGLLPAMVMLNADSRIRMLRNDSNDPPGIGTLAHLFLSGHTHAQYPAGKLPSSATAIRQGLLGPHQLQLVGGPLMLNQDGARAAPQGDPRHPDSFSHWSTDHANCQAQILRFYSNASEPNTLCMKRYTLSAGNGVQYRAVDESTMYLHF